MRKKNSISEKEVGLIDYFNFSVQYLNNEIRRMRTILQIMGQIRQLAEYKNGLTDEQIESIPQIEFSKNAQNLFCGDKCVICLTDLKEKQMVKGLKCKHFFHPECIDPWLKGKDECPVCRQKIVF
jgi:hypothetical protein